MRSYEQNPVLDLRPYRYGRVVVGKGRQNTELVFSDAFRFCNEMMEQYFEDLNRTKLGIRTLVIFNLDEHSYETAYLRVYSIDNIISQSKVISNSEIYRLQDARHPIHSNIFGLHPMPATLSFTLNFEPLGER